jgi:hypothetical protein
MFVYIFVPFSIKAHDDSVKAFDDLQYARFYTCAFRIIIDTCYTAYFCQEIVELFFTTHGHNVRRTAKFIVIVEGGGGKVNNFSLEY